jgi:Ser/Thr protein kinase RdoA (MazF antagonist)
MENKINAVMQEFGLDTLVYAAEIFGSGLIHKTYLIRKNGLPCFILQQVNHHVFKRPEDISHNLHIMGNFLSVHAPEYPFTFPVAAESGSDYVISEGNYFRIFRFITGTHTLDTCERPEHAYEAALEFGRFTAVLNGLRTDMLRYTIPGFHDLSSRFIEFTRAVEHGDAKRLAESRETAQWLTANKEIADQYEKIASGNDYIKRVTHHDTKISNVLLNHDNKGVCVIDLDTVMPGYFISDVGDMIRTYVSPANEEETNFEKIHFRKDFLKAIYSGYMENMGDLLTETERSDFLYAGKFMIYMQALRFYTDHLYNDRYYGARYPGHNLVRARNQVKLLEELFRAEKESISFS